MNRLLYLLVTTSVVGSEATVTYRSYIDSEVKSMTTADRFTTENSTVCEETCESKLCDAYNFNPTKSICQLIQLTSPAKKTFTCNRPVPVKIAACKYELATEVDQCLDCKRVTIENVGEGVRARCGNQTKLVFVPQESTRPTFTNNFMECNLTSAGWSHMGEVAGVAIKMGCSRIEDVDECRVEGACGKDQLCRNIPGGHTCTCTQGYTKNEDKCDDINECETTPDICPNGDCKNTPGDYRCYCKEGYSDVESGKCEDINECIDGTIDRNGVPKRACVPNADCLNTPGSYNCSCKQGYKMDDLEKCVRDV